MRSTNITALIHICDWWVTFTSLAGGDATDGDGSVVPKLDGLNQWPVISGASTVVRSEVFPAKGVLIQGRWKLVVGGVGGTAMWSGQHYPKIPATGPATLDCGKPGCLFDVEHDPEERINLNSSATHASVIATMSARLAALELTIWQADPAQTNTTIEQVCAATFAQGGWLTPANWHTNVATRSTMY
jgi:hypothetical protein